MNAKNFIHLKGSGMDGKEIELNNNKLEHMYVLYMEHVIRNNYWYKLSKLISQDIEKCMRNWEDNIISSEKFL